MKLKIKSKNINIYSTSVGDFGKVKKFWTFQFLVLNDALSLNIIFVVTDKVLHYLKKFDYLFLTITIYLLSIGLFYIPIGIFQREFYFKTFNESAPCTSDTNLICTADIFWTCIRYCFLGPVGYMMFSFLFHKVSYIKLGKSIRIL